MELRRLVETSFGQPQKCYGHCDQPTTLKFIESGEPAVACYACPAGYVSKAMAYGTGETREALRSFVTKALDGQPVKDDDIRVATRHSWDLGVEGFEMKVAYWTQNYRGSKNADPNRRALFICSECGSTYVKPLAEPGTLCATCNARSAGRSDRP